MGIKDLIAVCGLESHDCIKGSSTVFESELGKVIFTQCESEFLKDFPAEMKDYVTVGIYANNGATLYKMEGNIDTPFNKIVELRNAIYEVITPF